ncbi:hypothetical protein [Burkholderia ubonensis]|uniref:hypothetical protein n=1 Tax=Burkholderia ubonensis TaxID=101571 RepID=UPI0012BB0A66|nr:hypothetical protein [Burkholderia ubonensis]
MAFYAEVYGYIARKEAGEIPLEVIEYAAQSSAIFCPCFSDPVAMRSAYYISFACSVKFDEGEDELWLSPFEIILRKMDFSSASVSILHEEVSHIMMYSYVRDRVMQRFSSKLIEQSVEESSIPIE